MVLTVAGSQKSSTLFSTHNTYIMYVVNARTNKIVVTVAVVVFNNICIMNFIVFSMRIPQLRVSTHVKINKI